MTLSVALCLNAAQAITVDLGTELPEIILEDTIELNGTAQGSLHFWRETTQADFEGGTLFNLTMDGDALALMPGLDVQELNNGEPVFEPASSTEWDRNLIQLNVIKVGGTYYMHYVGGDASPGGVRHIGLGTSPDGLSWTRYSSSPVLEAGVDSYDSVSMHDPKVLIENGTWHMWYGGNVDKGSLDVSASYATSADGKAWTKWSKNPVIKNDANDNAWDGVDVRPQGVLRVGGELWLYYYGADHAYTPQLGLARSKDGENWTKDAGNPLYKGGSGWEASRTFFGTAEMVDGSFRIWTSAGRAPGLQLGFITSSDGRSWTDSGAPLISPRANSWYEKNIRWPCVVDEGDHYKLYAQGHDWSDCRTFGAFKLTPLRLTGSYTSRVKDLGGPYDLGGVIWGVNAPNGTSCEVLVRYGNTTGGLSGWKEVAERGDAVGARARYVQYRVLFHAKKDWMRGLRMDWLRLNYTEPLELVEFSVDGGPWQPARLGPGTWSANVSLHDGDYDILLRASSLDGNQSLLTIPVRVDLFPPTGAIELEGGRDATGSRDLRYMLWASDTHGVPECRVSLSEDMTGVGWSPFAETGTVRYEGPDGPVVVHAELRDGAGRTTMVNDTILVDTTPPEGNLTINGGERFTWDRNVTLHVEWTDVSGVYQVVISNYASFQNPRFVEPAHTYKWALPDRDGQHTVFVKLVDAVGNEAVLSASIVLDTVPPAATMLINNGAEFARSPSVFLFIYETEEGEVVARFANGGHGFPEEWRAVTDGDRIPWQLEEGADGTREVRMQVRDATGNEKVVVDSILLDTTPPGGDLSFPECGAWTNSSRVLVQLEAWDDGSGVDGFRTSSDGSFEGVPWDPPQGTFHWRAPDGEGERTLHVQLRDRAGNEATLRASLVVDMTPPTGSFRIGDGSAHVNTSLVTLHLEFQDELSGMGWMRGCVKGGLGGLDLAQYCSTMAMDLGRDEGSLTVTLQVMDRAGNVYTSTKSVTLDMTPPVVRLSLEGGGEPEEGESRFEVRVDDIYDPDPTVEWRLDGGRWHPVSGGGFDVRLSKGRHKVVVRAVDAAGNVESQEWEGDARTSVYTYAGWLLVVVLVVAVTIGSYLWVRRRHGGPDLGRT